MSNELIKKVKELEKEIKIYSDNFNYFNKRQDYEGLTMSQETIRKLKFQLENVKKELNEYNASREKGLKQSELKNIINVIEYYELPIKEVSSVRNIKTKRYVSIKFDDILFHIDNSDKKLYDYIMDWINKNYLKNVVNK